MASNSTTAFTGASGYSRDFESVVARAVAIRSLGLNTLNTGKARTLAESGAVVSLDTVFNNLQNAVTAIQSSTGLASLSSSVSTSGIVQASLAAGALPATYSIEVTALGAATNTLSKNGLVSVSDPATQNIGAGTSFTLTVNGVETAITPAAANLNSLVAAINTNSGLQVQASIVNIGSSGTPDYRLALQSTKLRADTIQLSNAGIPLLDTLSTGAPATFKVNGLATETSSDSRTVMLAPGLAVTLLQASPPGEASVITVTKSTTSTSNALSAFAVAYNAAVAEIDKNRGTSGGVLCGNSLLVTLSQSLRRISAYSTDAASAPDLTSLGFSFDKNGVLSFDATAFHEEVDSNPSALYSFLGGSTSGFIQSANNILAALEDPANGAIKTAITSLHGLADKQESLIAKEQDRIDQFRQDLTNRISAADSLIASLEQKVTFVTGLFDSMVNQKN